MDFSDKRVEGEIKYINDLTLSRVRTTHTMWIVSLGTLAAANGLSIQENQLTLMFLSLLIAIPFILSMAYQMESIIYCRAYLVARYYHEEPSFDDALFGSRIFQNEQHLRNATSFGSKFKINAITILALPYYFYVAIDIFILVNHFVKDGVSAQTAAYELAVAIFCISIISFVLKYLMDRYSASRFEAVLSFWKNHISAKSSSGDFVI